MGTIKTDKLEFINQAKEQLAIFVNELILRDSRLVYISSQKS